MNPSLKSFKSFKACDPFFGTPATVIFISSLPSLSFYLTAYFFAPCVINSEYFPSYVNIPSK